MAWLSSIPWEQVGVYAGRVLLIAFFASPFILGPWVLWMSGVTGQQVLGASVLIAIILGAGACYLLPTLIAAGRGHPNVGPIAVVNIFLGWTFLGFIVALAWSLSAVAPRPPAS
jgi:hypothetical protein